MSNYLAIATVTVALRDILQDAALSAVPGATVTTLRPNQAHAPGLEKAGINLYLYQTTPSPDWVNADLPTRDATGRLVQRPQTALHLDYLLSFQGSDLEMEPQRLLGAAVTSLHARSFLPLSSIQHAVENTGYLNQSDLLTQVERVKVAMLGLSLEELSKLWSVFFQIPYLLSFACRASVVLIEAQDEIGQPGIVKQPVITVTPGEH